ncbi:hypothetical protein AGMMS49944_09170 [Spirochaetia bacterium]|nr:hypothetical protein AGMMS49944_09170 [Spirochaetia bacterium]
MADQLENIVKVTITRQTRVPSMKSFSEHLVVDGFSPVGINPIFDPAHLVRQFGSLDEIAGAGFPVDGYVYRAASKQFSQSPHIGKIYVGLKMPGGIYDVEASVVGDWETGNVLKVMAGSDTLAEITYADGTMDTWDKVISQVVKEFNADFTETKLTKTSSRSLRAIGAEIPTAITITGGSDQAEVHWKDMVSGAVDPSYSEYEPYPEASSWTDALNKIKATNNDWYAISVNVRNMLDQQEVAQWIQANEKLGILTSGDPLVANEETGDIAAWAKLNNLDRVVIFYHPDAQVLEDAEVELNPLDPIPEAAYFGKMLTKHPGSATWKFKELQSVPTYELQQFQVTNVETKNATWYMSTADVPMTSDGKTAGGEYIDVIHGLDWLKALIQNYVFTPMIQLDKIPFTDEGVQIIVSQLRKALVEAVNWLVLASFEISYPAVADVALLMKGERTLPDVNFTGVLAGAIHRTIVNGTITL